MSRSGHDQCHVPRRLRWRHHRSHRRPVAHRRRVSQSPARRPKFATRAGRVRRKRQLPVVDDLGWAALADFESLGCGSWPQAVASLRDGADLVLACGDKLVGGPQCGIILGRRSQVETLARHPLARALQLDKLALAALAGTLRLYRKAGEAQRTIPIWQLLTAPLENLKLHHRANGPANGREFHRAHGRACLHDQRSGGLRFARAGNWPVGRSLWSRPRWAPALGGPAANGEPAVLGRMANERVYLDLRSVFPREDQQLVSAVLKLSEKLS